VIRFFNTLSGQVEEFVPLRPGEVSLYTCGPTVYSHQHVGNMRAYVFEDLLKRFLTASGYRVRHVMNITDVDDKTINGANAEGVSLRDYTRKYIDTFFADLDALNIRPADHYPRATDHIPEMVAMIKGLLEKGLAYRKDGSIYYSIAKFPAYGRLSKIRRDDLRPGQRVEADEYEKESVHDFALWKAPKPGEPVWETELGPGRPGWHIECSAMSAKYLGPTFDIHCGGVDNIFPHHENEIAQSEAYWGRPFVRFWLHCQHLVRDGEKMAKSKGNTTTVSELVAAGVDRLTVRYLLLSTHFRKVLNFTQEALSQAQAARERLLDFVLALEGIQASRPAAPGLPDLVAGTRRSFLTALGDDLNIAEALAALFEFIRSANSLIAAEALGADDARRALDFLGELDTVLGVLPSRERELLPEEVQQKIAAREAARQAGDYRRADEIRAELLRAGVKLEDTKDGVRWKRVRKEGPGT
jgi:cysteinyl-tRNA synthetase